VKKGTMFEITGSVVRRWVSPTGKFATITIGTPGRAKEQKTQVRAFDSGVIGQIGALEVGHMVCIQGDITTEALRNKAREDVKVDGYTAWVNELTVRSIKVESSSKAPQDKVEDKPTADKLDDDSVPF
jgi:hypothetical protein